MMRTILAIAAVAALAVGSVANAAIVNGSFELGTYAGGDPGWQQLSAGDTSITGWEVTDDNIDWKKNYWPAQDGEFSLDLTGAGSRGGIAQDIALVGGTEYTLSFWIAANWDDGTVDPKTVRVTVDGVDETFDAAFVADVVDWTQHTITFTPAVSDTYTLKFEDVSAAPALLYGVALDNVSISSIPEPSTIAIWAGMGLIGVTIASRRRRRS